MERVEFWSLGLVFCLSQEAVDWQTPGQLTGNASIVVCLLAFSSLCLLFTQRRSPSSGTRPPEIDCSLKVSFKSKAQYLQIIKKDFITSRLSSCVSLLHVGSTSIDVLQGRPADSLYSTIDLWNTSSLWEHKRLETLKWLLNVFWFPLS